MKRILAALLVFVIFAFAAAPLGSAQTRRHRRHRTFWQKHRDKLTVAGTGLAGAGTGAIIGGKKGALIGAGAGAGAGALYTYKLRKKHKHRRRY